MSSHDHASKALKKSKNGIAIEGSFGIILS